MKNKPLLISFLAFVLFSIIMTDNAYGRDHVIYYVSSSIGNDKSNGLTETTPKQHISAIKEKNNVTIRLKCDDVFYEQIRDYSYSTIESFGQGEKPVLCGFKVLLKSDAWAYDAKSRLWKIELQRKDVFGGMDDGDEVEDRVNNVGFIYDATNDAVYGHLV